jgi:hypothetical protein
LSLSMSVTESSAADSPSSVEPRGIPERKWAEMPHSEYSVAGLKPTAALVPLMVIGLIIMIVGVLSLLAELARGGDIRIITAFNALVGLMFFLIAFTTRRRGSRTAQYIWQKGDRLAPLAESRGTSAVTVFAIPFAMCISVIVGILFFDDAPLLFYIAVGAMLSVALSVGLFRSKIMVQSDSILLGIPSGPIMGRLPLDKVHSIRQRGRLLRVVLKEKANPLSSRTQRILILGSPKPIATAIHATGIVRGYDFSVENVELDPALLKSFMTMLQTEDDGLMRGADGGYVADYGALSPVSSSYPEIVSALLAIAGIFALLFSFGLLTVDRIISDEYGRHIVYIECCMILEIVFAVLIFVGAVMARRRKRYGFVRTSAILAIISFGGFVSTVLGIVSLFLLWKCADEFED